MAQCLPYHIPLLWFIIVVGSSCYVLYHTMYNVMQSITNLKIVNIPTVLMFVMSDKERNMSKGSKAKDSVEIF